jgi:hypothetical protein
MKMGTEDADAFRVGEDSVDKIMYGTARVWPNGGGIDDFAATDASYSAVTCTWSAWDVEPVAQYDLYEDGLLVAELVTSPYEHEVSAGTREYFVMGFNTNENYESNHDTGSVQVYIPPPDPEPPGYTSGFVASDTLTEQIDFSWFAAVGAAYYSIFDGDDNAVITGISGLSTSKTYTGAVANTWFYVIAYNSDGATVGSGDNGACVAEYVPPPPDPCVPGSVYWSVPGTYYWLCPVGVTAISICITASGGGGYGNNNQFSSPGGGWAGAQVSTTLAVTEGLTYEIVVGAGSVGGYQYDNTIVVPAGGELSSFHTVVAPGGPTDLIQGYYGDDTVVSCYGTAYAGTDNFDVPGGQAGFGNGGAANIATGTTGGPGDKGSGGGAGFRGTGGTGGHGYVGISWVCP